MHESIIETIVFWIMDIISQFGYTGIIVLMGVESALIPIPSEVIMPFSGFLASQGRFSLFGISLAGAFGNLIGSWIAYFLGHAKGEKIIRKLIQKYGKFLLLTENEYDKSIELFKKYGQWVAAISRVVPGIRTVISLPAGVARLPLLKFSALTFFGSLIWSYFLGYIGYVLGENWEQIRPIFRKFDIIIIFITVFLMVAYVYHKLIRKKV